MHRSRDDMAVRFVPSVRLVANISSSFSRPLPEQCKHRANQKTAAYRKYGTAARGAIMLLFSSVSVKYLTSRSNVASKQSIDATLPQR